MWVIWVDNRHRDYLNMTPQLINASQSPRGTSHISSARSCLRKYALDHHLIPNSLPFSPPSDRWLRARKPALVQGSLFHIACAHLESHPWNPDLFPPWQAAIEITANTNDWLEFIEPVTRAMLAWIAFRDQHAPVALAVEVPFERWISIDSLTIPYASHASPRLPPSLSPRRSRFDWCAELGRSAFSEPDPARSAQLHHDHLQEGSRLGYRWSTGRTDRVEEWRSWGSSRVQIRISDYKTTSKSLTPANIANIAAQYANSPQRRSLEASGALGAGVMP